MKWKWIGFVAGLGLLTAAPARAVVIEDIAPGSYEVSYFDVSSSFKPSQQGYGGPGHSGGAGDGLVRMVDVGNWEADPVEGRICANIYVFDDDQELQECCSCLLTADSVKTASVINNLTANPQFDSPLGLGVIKIVTSTVAGSPFNPVTGTPGVAPFGCTSGGTGVPGTAGSIVTANLTDGLVVWLSHAESMASNNGGFTPPWGFVTSTSVEKFSFAALDSTELFNTQNGLVPRCLEVEEHSSGRGICTCGLGS